MCVYVCVCVCVGGGGGGGGGGGEGVGKLGFFLRPEFVFHLLFYMA